MAEGDPGLWFLLGEKKKEQVSEQLAPPAVWGPKRLIFLFQPPEHQIRSSMTGGGK